MLILSPTKEAQIGSKEPKNRQNLNFERGLTFVADSPEAFSPKRAARASGKLLVETPRR
jgi:hypothetical protein